MTIEETLDVKFNENSSSKIPTNPAELFDPDVLKINTNSDHLSNPDVSIIQSQKTGDCRYDISPAVVSSAGNFTHKFETAGYQSAASASAASQVTEASQSSITEP